MKKENVLRWEVLLVIWMSTPFNTTFSYISQKAKGKKKKKAWLFLKHL